MHSISPGRAVSQIVCVSDGAGSNQLAELARSPKNKHPGPSRYRSLPRRGPRFRRQENFYSSQESQTRGFAENLEIFCLSTRHPHDACRYPPGRRILHRLIHSYIHSLGIRRNAGRSGTHGRGAHSRRRARSATSPNIVFTSAAQADMIPGTNRGGNIIAMAVTIRGTVL